MLIIIVVVLVLAIVGVGLALFWQPGLLNANKTNQAQNQNTSTSNQNASVTNQSGNPGPPVGFEAKVLETKDVNETKQYRNLDIPIERVEITDGYEGIGAAKEGEKLVIIYFKKEIAGEGANITSWLGQEVQLLDSAGATYSFDRAQFIPQDAAQSYVAFSVGKDAKGFTLRLVRPDEDVTVDLGI